MRSLPLGGHLRLGLEASQRRRTEYKPAGVPSSTRAKSFVLPVFALNRRGQSKTFISHQLVEAESSLWRESPESAWRSSGPLKSSAENVSFDRCLRRSERRSLFPWDDTLVHGAVVSGIQPENQFGHGNVEGLADAEQRRDGDGSACLNLLPMPGGESKRNHIFLSVFLPLAQRANPPAKSAEKLLLIYHA